MNQHFAACSGLLAKLSFAHYIRPRKAKEADMICSIPQNISGWLVASTIAAVLTLPPRDPNDDDDENEVDKEDENEQEEEPAVIKEPDE
jgi:hypothetical protein